MEFDDLVNQFAKKGHHLEDLGEEKYHNRYRFTSISFGDDIELIKNHVNTLGELENILKLLTNKRIGKYEVEFIKLIIDEAQEEKYSELMTKMEAEFNIPLLNDSVWSDKNKDVIALYKVIANQRDIELEEDWELEV